MSPTVSELKTSQRPRKPKKRKTSANQKQSWQMTWTQSSGTISIIEMEIAKNPTFLQKEIDTGNTNNATIALITVKPLCQEPSANSVNDDEHTTEQITDVSRGNKHSRPRWDRTVLSKLGTLTTVENAHSRRRETRSREDYSEIHGQTRQHSKVIKLPRKTD